MATSNNSRDVKMTLSVETLGEENIKKLQTTVSNLAKEGGDAAPEFQKLADEIGRIGEQAAALQAFTELATQTDVLAQRQEQAATTAGELRARLETLSTASQEAAERQRVAATALEDAQQAARATRDELATLAATTDRAGKAEASYASEVQRLKLAKIEQRAEIERLSDALKNSNQEVKEAEAAEARLATSYKRAATESERATRVLQQNAVQVREAADAALDLGVTTDNIAAAQAELVQGLNRTGRAAEGLRTDIERLAERERELAGIRAFDEQVQAASRLQKTAEYARLFEQAIHGLAESERELKAQSDADQWQREAEALVEAAHAAQKLSRETEILQAAQAELTAQRAFEKQAQDARKMLQAAEYVRFWREELDKAEAQVQRTAEESRLSAERIKTAFGTLGVRSAQELKVEIAQVRAAMETVRTSAGLTGGSLRTAFSAGDAKIKQLEREIRQVTGAMTSADRVAKLFKNSMGQIAAGNIIADGFGYLVNKVKEMGRAFVETIVQTQQLRRGLQAVYQDSVRAASQFVFLKQAASNAGISIGDIQQAFVKFAAAAEGAGISVEVTNNLFASATRAAGALGLSGEQVTGMLEALGQMASKGTVSMEELRQQLGDRLPGALNRVAEGLGLTTAQLIKLVENGGLSARDLFDALTKSLNKVQGETNGLLPTWNRLKNVMTETAQAAGDSAWTAILSGGLKALTVVVGGVSLVFAGFSEALGLVGKAIALLGPGVGSFKDRIKLLGEATEEAAARQALLTKSVSDNINGIQSAAVAQQEHTGKLEDSADAAAKLSGIVVTTAKAQEAQALASKLAADSTRDYGSRLVELKAFIDTLLSAQTKQIEAAGKLAKAAKIEGDSLVQLTELRGQDYLTLEAQVQASEKYESSLQKLSDAQRSETELLVLKRDEIIKTALARDGNTRQYQVEIDEIEKKIVASKAETEQAGQAAAAAKQEAAVRKLAAQTYRDNSAAIGEYRNAMQAAEQTLAAMVAAQERGEASDENVISARQRAAAATRLYNDAVADSIKAIELESRVKQANTNLTLTKLQIEQRNYESLSQAARASGDFRLALYYEIEARRRQIEMIKLSSEAKRLEADATLRALEVERAALDQTDPLLKQKQAEIDIRIANAKAKLLEANAGKDAIAALEREIQLLRDSENAREHGRNGIEKDTASRYRNAEAIDRQSSALNKQQKLTSDGFAANADGSLAGQASTTTPLDAAAAIITKMRSGDLSAHDLPAAEAAVRQAKNQQDWLSSVSAGAKSSAAITGAEAMVREAERALAKVRDLAEREQEGGGRGFDGKGGQDRGRRDTKTVNITIKGVTTPVEVASDSDVNNLTSVLRQLESAAGASS